MSLELRREVEAGDVYLGVDSIWTLVLHNETGFYHHEIIMFKLWPNQFEYIEQDETRTFDLFHLP